MWLESCDNLAELCRGYLPYYLLIALPIFIVVSPINPVIGAHELPVYRMHQYDLHGVSHGCRSTSIQLEAKSLTSWRTSRHCIITRMSDLTPELYHIIRKKAGALIVMLPKSLKSLTEQEQEHILSLEMTMISSEDVMIPVYFAPWSLELDDIINDLESGFINEKKKSELESLISAISASGYQVTVGSGQPNRMNGIKIPVIQGRLSGSGAEEKLPTIALIAYYDSNSVATELATGAESNASGVAMLLELARIFSGLYKKKKSRPQYNIVFLLSGAGKMNYFGSKKWLEDQFDTLEGSIIQDASFVICLEAVSSSNNLYLHVSKPPKENSFGSLFFKELNLAGNLTYNINVEGVHKKINLADELLAWEHERYSIRRLSAATLSTFKNYDNQRRNTILDVIKDGEIDQLYKNTLLISEALAKRLYNFNSTSTSSFTPPLDVSKDYLTIWLNYLTLQSRSTPLLTDKYNPLINSLQDVMTKYLSDVKVLYYSVDKRDPEFAFYDNTKNTMNLYIVKPAIFDLFLTIAIVIYLSIVYLIIRNFHFIYSLYTKVKVT